MCSKGKCYATHTMQTLSEEVKPNKYMILPKVAYLLANAGFGILQTCLPLFLKSVGLHPSEVGYTNALRCVAFAFAPGFWGLAADKGQCHRSVFIALCFVSILTLIPQPWVAIYLYKGEIRNSTIKPASEHTRIKLLVSSTGNKSAFALNQDLLVNSSNAKFSSYNTSYPEFTLEEYASSEEDRKVLFLVLLIWNFIAAIFHSPLLNFLVTVINKMVETCKIKTNVGKQLRFGPIGYSIGVLVVTIGSREFANLNTSLSMYTPLFIVVCLSYVGLCASSFYVFRRKQRPSSTRDEEEAALNSKTLPKSNIKGKLCDSFKNGYITFFLVWVFCYGACGFMHIGFLFIFLSDMNASPILLGLATLADEGLAILIFPFTQRIISRIGGELQGMALTTCIMSIKLLLFSLVHKPSTILLYLVLTCASFPLLLTVMVRFIHSQVDHSIETTMMGVAYGVYYGIGAMAGSFISGIMFEKYGGRSLFRIGSAIMGFWTVLIMLTLAYRGNPTKCCRKTFRLRMVRTSVSSAKSCNCKDKSLTTKC